MANVLMASEGALGAHAAKTNNPHAVTKAQVGLGNVDNTADANKPVSTAVRAELALKQDKLSDAQMTKVNNALTNPNAFDAAGTAASAVETERVRAVGVETSLDGRISSLSSSKQPTLVSGTNIKTINGETILGAGNLTVRGLPTHTSAQSGKVLKVDATGDAVWGDAPSGEPDEYLKSVSFQVGKVMLTKKDGEEVEVTADDLGAYVKSDDGIPYDDLDEGVQSSLDLADSAVQDVSDKRGIADRRSYRYEWSDDNLPSDCIFKVHPYYDGMSGAWQCIVKDDVEGYEYRCTASGNASSTELTFTGINHLGASFSFGTEAEDDTEYVPDDGNLLALESQVPTIDEKAKWNAKLSPVSGTTDTAPKAAALTTSGESALLSKVDTRVSAACPYPATAVTSGATLAAGAISVYTPTASETAATFTLPVPASGKSADVVMLIDCTAAAPTLTVGLPTGKTATWLDAQDALTYAIGKVYERMYTIIPTADAYFVTFADKELTQRAS